METIQGVKKLDRLNVEIKTETSSDCIQHCVHQSRGHQVHTYSVNEHSTGHTVSEELSTRYQPQTSSLTSNIPYSGYQSMGRSATHSGINVDQVHFQDLHGTTGGNQGVYPPRQHVRPEPPVAHQHHVSSKASVIPNPKEMDSSGSSHEYYRNINGTICEHPSSFSQPLNLTSSDGKSESQNPMPNRILQRNADLCALVGFLEEDSSDNIPTNQPLTPNMEQNFSKGNGVERTSGNNHSVDLTNQHILPLSLLGEGDSGNRPFSK